LQGVTVPFYVLPPSNAVPLNTILEYAANRACAEFQTFLYLQHIAYYVKH
jgi:hypothetical protein